jgi:hypothetical protein
MYYIKAMDFNELYILLGKEEYFTREQILFLVDKLKDKNFNSFYLQSIMSADKKKINK